MEKKEKKNSLMGHLYKMGNHHVPFQNIRFYFWPFKYIVTTFQINGGFVFFIFLLQVNNSDFEHNSHTFFNNQPFFNLFYLYYFKSIYKNIRST